MDFEVVRKIPAEIHMREILRVLGEFYSDCEMYIDFNGFISHTLERFSWATFMNVPSWELWLATEGDQIKCFVLTSLDKSADNNFCYFVHQAWVAKDIRDTGFSKTWWKKIKERAKQLLCKQIILFSIRDYEAYNRFCGGGLKVYAQMLHLELEV